MATDADIIMLADRSPLLRYDWPDRGIAPRAYLRGMAVACANLFAILKANDDGSVNKKAVARATADHIGAPTSDVLAWYAAEIDAAGANTDIAENKLVALFAIMLALGMQESSGKYCEGADTEKNRGKPTTEANAEAGLFQVSYDSINNDRLNQALFDAYQDRTDLLDIFSVGVNCDEARWHNVGTGAGKRFQETMKRCPLFAVLYTAQYLRGHRRDWSPINYKQAEVHPDAVVLFSRIGSTL